MSTRGAMAFAAGIVLAITLAALGVASGCRPRPSSRPLLTCPPSPDSLRAALAAQRSLTGVNARGLVRFELERAGIEAPVLDLRLALDVAGGCRAMLRPGVLAPVLSFWADAQGWGVRLPRERLAFESATDSAAAGGSTATRLPSGLPAEAARLVLAPHELARLLEAVDCFVRDGDWILRGRMHRGAPWVAAAELWIDGVSGRISRWALLDATGTTLLRVVYDHPWEGPRPGRRILILAPGLAVAAIELTEAAEKPVVAPPRPALPRGWQRLPPEALPPYLEDLAFR